MHRAVHNMENKRVQLHLFYWGWISFKLELSSFIVLGNEHRSKKKQQMFRKGLEGGELVYL